MKNSNDRKIRILRVIGMVLIFSILMTTQVFAAPISGNWHMVVSCEFGGYEGHTGIDFAIPTGTPILASQPGTVSKVRKGNTIQVMGIM